MIKIKAVLFDCHETLVHVENPVTVEEISEQLLNKGYEVSPQQLSASSMFVAFIDYPKYGYKNWHSYLSRVFWRLKVKVDKKTLKDIVKLQESNPYQLYADATEAVRKAKKSGLRTAVVTTIAYFKFKKAIKPIKKYLDFVMTGFEAKCDKTNPKMYRKVLEVLKVKPEEAVMIGDNIQVDVLLPNKLGIPAILLDRKCQNLKCHEAKAVVSNLPQAIETILASQTN